MIYIIIISMLLYQGPIALLKKTAPSVVSVPSDLIPAPDSASESE